MKHTILLVDASGSMYPYVKDTKETIKSILDTIKKDKISHFTLIYFDTGEYQIVTDSFSNTLDADTFSNMYSARGGTPITDAVYKSVQDIIKEINDIEKLSQEHKFIIFTDGGENSSIYAKAEELGASIEHFSNNFGWDFQFIGPKSQENEIRRYTDSIKISKDNVSLYADMSEGLTTMYQKTTKV